MRQRQKGMTLIGFLLTAIIAGAIVFAGLRLVPIYLEYMKVESVMNGARDEFNGQSPSAPVVRASIETSARNSGSRVALAIAEACHRS